MFPIIIFWIPVLFLFPGSYFSYVDNSYGFSQFSISIIVLMFSYFTIATLSLFLECQFFIASKEINCKAIETWLSKISKFKLANSVFKVFFLLASRVKTNEQNFRDLWDYKKWTNIHDIGVPGAEKKKENAKRYLKK